MIEGPAVIRAYSAEDERSWLRCRVLGFLGTAYFDDVLQAKPAYDTDTAELLAIAAGARIEDESALRSEFSRVHVCRRYELAIGDQLRG